ncbi:MAG: DUF3127 domain-containing protein [Prevotella sp.]|nr:DUF3127 domain-containing protein [Prevotella sp.]
MEIQGKIIAALPEKTGSSDRGEWKVQEFVLETFESFPKKMVFSVFGADRLARFNIQVGQTVNVSFDIDAREYNNRWFNSIRAFDVRQITTPSVEAPFPPAGGEFMDPFSTAPTNNPTPVAAAPQPAVQSATQAATQPTATTTTTPFPPQQENAAGGQSEDDLPF